MTDYQRRREQIQGLLKEWQGRLAFQRIELVDYEVVARSISHEVGVPVVVFAVSGERAVLVAYEVPNLETAEAG